MVPSAPLHVPIEIRPKGGPSPRLFRLARAVSLVQVRLEDGLPDDPSWLRGPLLVRFVLPGGGEAVECGARAREVVLDEGTPLERGALAALELDGVPPDAAKRIESYVEERLQEA